MRVAVVTSHPIQYQAPWFRGLAQRCDLHVYFAHRQSAPEQAAAGYGVAFDWDVDLSSGYEHGYLRNVARSPSVYRYGGCDTPEIGTRLAEGGFDALIVTGWYLKAYWQAVLAARRLRIPALVRGDSALGTPRPWLVRALKQPVYRVGLTAFSAFLSVGKRHTEYLRHYGVSDRRIFFAPHFVDAAFFTAPFASGSPERAATRARMGFAGDTPLIVFVGRLVDFKRPLDLVRAAGALRRQGCDVQLAFVGDGLLRPAIERCAREEGVAAHILGFRNQSELPALYAAADALALPSDARETWGLVVNEAMSCGLPAVVSASAGCAPDLIDEGGTGFSYPCGDVAQLADAIVKVAALRSSPGTGSRIAARVATYSREACVAGTLGALEAVVRKP